MPEADKLLDESVLSCADSRELWCYGLEPRKEYMRECAHVQVSLDPHPESRELATAPGQVHESVYSVSFMFTWIV